MQSGAQGVSLASSWEATAVVRHEHRPLRDGQLFERRLELFPSRAAAGISTWLDFAGLHSCRLSLNHDAEKIASFRHTDFKASMPTPAVFPKIRRKRSSLHGYGVFALEPINKNRRIVHYAGELVRNDRAEEREERYLAQGCIWVFRLNRRWSRDGAVGGNVARFINHSCRPNCWFQVVGLTIWIRASRLIQANEELTYDYATVGKPSIRCRCRPDCPNWL
jgi:hypothetical protein